MADKIQIGDQVEIFLNAKKWGKEGWFEGTVVRIDPYSGHRSFYWVEFDKEVSAILGLKQISVFNPKNIRKAG